VFLGIENVLDQDLAFLRPRPRTRARGRPHDRQRDARAIELLHRHGMLVVGGLIVGNPGDTRESIEANLAFARRTWTGRTSSTRRRTPARR
jgi:anaerobic magnesium-protoporphyrin IX monomethyl ester cyclase